METKASPNQGSYAAACSFFHTHNGQEVLLGQSHQETNELTTVTEYCCLMVALFTEAVEEAELLLQWDLQRGPACHLEDNFTSWRLSSSKMRSSQASNILRTQIFLISTNSHLPGPEPVMEALAGMALASSIFPKCQLFSFKDHKGFCFSVRMYPF